MPRTRHRAHINHARYRVCLKQAEEFLERARGMTNRHYQRRRFFFWRVLFHALWQFFFFFFSPSFFFFFFFSFFLFSARSWFAFDFLQRRSLVHRQMVGRGAFDQILRLLLRGADRVALERDGRGDLFLDRSPDVAGFRVPPHLISNFKVLLHRYDPL